jgi:CII-binding regulator of phage lambda lysogenization HflD
MTDNEFEKVIEQCKKNENCIGCPLEHLDYSSECVSAIIEYCYDKINRQEAEIERLQTEKDNLIKTFGECQKDVIKEFADRVKAFPCADKDQKHDIKVIVNDVLKEMVGEDK